MIPMRFKTLLAVFGSIACTSVGQQDGDRALNTDDETAVEARGGPESGSPAGQSLDEDADPSRSDISERALDSAAADALDAAISADTSSAGAGEGGPRDAGADSRDQRDAATPEAAVSDAPAADAAFLSVGTDHCLPAVAAARCSVEAPYAYACNLEISLLAPAINCLPPETSVADDGAWCCPVQYCARMRASTNCPANLFEYVCPTTLEIPRECTVYGAPDGGARSLCCPDIPPPPPGPLTWS